MYTKKPVEQSSYPQPRSHLGYTEGRLISLLHVHTSPITINTIISHSTTHKIIEPRNGHALRRTRYLLFTSVVTKEKTTDSSRESKTKNIGIFP